MIEWEAETDTCVLLDQITQIESTHANNIVPDQTAPRSSLVWYYLFAFFTSSLKVIPLVDNARSPGGGGGGWYSDIFIHT